MEDLVELDFWEKYIDEQAELEDMCGICSIWSIICNFEKIVKDFIVEAMDESAVLEKVVTDSQAADVGQPGEKYV